MKECWKRALDRYWRLGLLDEMPTKCDHCHEVFRYSDDVEVYEQQLQEKTPQTFSVTRVLFIHTTCKSRLEN